ncbi:MAG: hypothetical protein Q9167_004800 [Letrouitia subvulpina]
MRYVRARDDFLDHEGHLRLRLNGVLTWPAVKTMTARVAYPQAGVRVRVGKQYAMYGHMRYISYSGATRRSFREYNTTYFYIQTIAETVPPCPTDFAPRFKILGLVTRKSDDLTVIQWKNWVDDRTGVNENARLEIPWSSPDIEVMKKYYFIGWLSGLDTSETVIAHYSPYYGLGGGGGTSSQ